MKRGQSDTDAIDEMVKNITELAKSGMRPDRHIRRLGTSQSAATPMLNHILESLLHRAQQPFFFEAIQAPSNSASQSAGETIDKGVANGSMETLNSVGVESFALEKARVKCDVDEYPTSRLIFSTLASVKLRSSRALRILHNPTSCR